VFIKNSTPLDTTLAMESTTDEGGGAMWIEEKHLPWTIRRPLAKARQTRDRGPPVENHPERGFPGDQWYGHGRKAPTNRGSVGIYKHVNELGKLLGTCKPGEGETAARDWSRKYLKNLLAGGVKMSAHGDKKRARRWGK